jgi:hypothetical protein
MARLTSTVPDEHGFYWLRMGSVWYLAFVDTGEEEVRLISDDGKAKCGTFALDSAELDKTANAWFGPLNCPGGDFGSHTVVLDEELMMNAAQMKKAMVLQHIDYRFCADEKHRASITSTGVYTREEADKVLKRAAESFANE